MRRKDTGKIFAVLLGLGGLALMSLLPLRPLGAEPAPASGNGSGSTVAAPGRQLRVFAYNDLGMHCYDRSFAVLSFLPLFNVLRAQVISVGTVPTILPRADARLFYKARADGEGSINTTSAGKTNFWDYAGQLYHLVNPTVDVGLLGARMPGPGNARRPFTSFERSTKQFLAQGIPITSYDDAGNKNSFPLMDVLAVDRSTGKVAASLPTVVPVSDEMHCEGCHATGKVAAQAPGFVWSRKKDPLVQATENILHIHDHINGTTLFRDRPQLCASCHYSKALDLNNSGPPANGALYMSHAIHWWHSGLIPETPGSSRACYRCHPGSNTRCLRGTMATSGIVCSDCHGTLAAVASSDREPWVDLPRCQSCHTGDVLNHLGSDLRMRIAYDDSPNVATPRKARNKTFAENPNPLTPGKSLLYKESLGHGGVACEACHGSTHAEWPTREPNDNLAAMELQGYRGKIMECSVCHGSGQRATMDGPHGLHNVNSTEWVLGHNRFVRTGVNCKRCHGQLGEGAVLSINPVARSFDLPPVLGGGTVKIPAKTQVGCGHCHGNPLGGP